MAPRRIAWILNLDADVELAAIASGAAGARTAYSPKKSLVEATRTFGPKLAERLLDPELDVLIDEDSPPLSARGFVGRAFCPTPRALRVFARAGAEPEPHPEADVLVRVNARTFCSSLGRTLEGAAFITTEEAALTHLETAPPNAIADRWRVKRNFGMTGRGQRVIDRAAFSDSDRAFVRAGIAEGGVQIEPNVRIVAERAIHGRLTEDGAFVLGPVMQQVRDVRGAWVSSAPISIGEDTSALRGEAERVAAALHREKYFGPFGVDSFVYENGNGAALQPRSEINARYSMGFPASLLSRDRSGA